MGHSLHKFTGNRPNSCHDPSIHTSAFKGEMCRAIRLCSSPTQAKNEVDYILNVYEDNGHDRKSFQKIAETYKPPDNRKNEMPTNLFAVLPFHNDPQNNNNGSNKNNNNNYVPTQKYPSYQAELLINSNAPSIRQAATPTSPPAKSSRASSALPINRDKTRKKAAASTDIAAPHTRLTTWKFQNPRRRTQKGRRNWEVEPLRTHAAHAAVQREDRRPSHPR